jgi:hypothetical protein
MIASYFLLETIPKTNKILNGDDGGGDYISIVSARAGITNSKINMIKHQPVTHLEKCFPFTLKTISIQLFNSNNLQKTRN